MADSAVQPRAAIVVVGAGAVSLAVAMGIGRFAFTPLLPMMLHDGVVTLQFGSWLATANYLGYLVGALLCMAIPRNSSSAAMIRYGLVATVLLSLGMALHWPTAWLVLRFLSGVASAVVFVFTSGWCLTRLASLGAPALGGAIYTGPGAGIAISGLAATGMVALDWSAAAGWLMFGLLAALLTAGIWPIFADALLDHPGSPPANEPSQPQQPAPAPITGGRAEMAVFTMAYGLAGFGYIITATFLPVIARETLPDSVWLDLFWPILGLAVVIGALLATRVPRRLDPRLALVVCYACQATGVGLTLFIPTLSGFVVASLLVGLPFTSISFFVMQEVRRLRPHHVARFMGLLTAVYGIGQILGPLLAGFLLAHSATPSQGFGLSLAIASATLVFGAVLYGVMSVVWPVGEAEAGRS